MEIFLTFRERANSIITLLYFFVFSRKTEETRSCKWKFRFWILNSQVIHLAHITSAHQQQPSTYQSRQRIDLRIYPSNIKTLNSHKHSNTSLRMSPTQSSMHWCNVINVMTPQLSSTHHHIDINTNTPTHQHISTATHEHIDTSTSTYYTPTSTMSRDRGSRNRASQTLRRESFRVNNFVRMASFTRTLVCHANG
jgi:hypothetical protein